MAEILESSSAASLRQRIARIKSELEEADIIAKEVDLVCRTTEEYLVLARLRELHLAQAKDRAAKLIGDIPPPVDKNSTH
jgi:hypothetical protein